MAASDAELKIIASLDDQVSKSIQKLLGEVGTLSDEAKKAFDDMRAAAAKAKEKVEDTGTAAEETAKSTKKVGEEGKKAGDSIGKAFADSAIQFAATAVSVNLLVEQIKKFLDETAKVGVALARIQASNNLTAEAAEDLGDKLSVVFGLFRDVATREEILASAQVLLNEKFATGQDVVFKVADALGFARTQGITLAESTKLLVDVSGAFVNASTNSIEVLSKLRQVQKGTASDFKILAEGFDRIGNTAQAAGVRFDDLLSAFTVLRNAGTSERESLKFLEVILQNLQVNAAEVDKQFRNIGKTFDAQTISTAGLSQTIGNLYSGIKAGGGDAQEQFKKIFGGQAQANAAFAIGVERSGEYFAALNNLSKASQEYFKDVSLVSTASGEAFRFTEAIDIVNNVRGVYNALSGDLLEFSESNLKFQKAQADGSAAATRGVIDLQFEASIAADKAKELGAAGSEAATSFSEKLREARPDIIAFFDALAGKQADAEIEKVKKFANDLREQAKKFSELGVPEFSGADLEATLRRIGELESKLVEEIFAKRTALADEAAEKEAQRLLDLKNKAAAASQAQADRDRAASDEKAARDLRLEEEKRRQEEQTILLRQQAELQAYQANLQRIRESAALARQLIEEGVSGAGAQVDFFGNLAAQVQPLADEILVLEGKLANSILSNEERDEVVARIQSIRDQIRGVGQEAVTTGAAFDAGFTGALDKFVKETANRFKEGTDLASAGIQSFQSSFSGFLNDIVLGSKKASDAFKDFIRNFISGIVQAINQLIALKIASAILTAIGFAGGAAGGANASQAAELGGFTVGEKGGVMPGQMQSTIPAGSSLASMGTGKPMGGASFFADGGVMPGKMLADATGLPLKAYARGGVTTEPQIAVFGEGRGAEAFVPLPGPNRGIPVEFQNRPELDFAPLLEALRSRSSDISFNVDVPAPTFDVPEPVYQFDVPEPVYQFEVPEPVYQFDVPEPVYQFEVPEPVYQFEVPEPVYQFDVPEPVYQFEVPEPVYKFDVPEPVYQFEVPEPVYKFDVPEPVYKFEVPEPVYQFEVPEPLYQFDVPEPVYQFNVPEPVYQFDVPEPVIELGRVDLTSLADRLVSRIQPIEPMQPELDLAPLIQALSSSARFDRGVPVEFQNTPAAMSTRRDDAAPTAPVVNINLDYNPRVQALDGEGAKGVLLREARVIGDIVAAEIASGANRSLRESVRMN